MKMSSCLKRKKEEDLCDVMSIYNNIGSKPRKRRKRVIHGKKKLQEMWYILKKFTF
jgi:uncharacterized protein YwgA